MSATRTEAKLLVTSARLYIDCGMEASASSAGLSSGEQAGLLQFLLWLYYQWCVYS